MVSNHGGALIETKCDVSTDYAERYVLAFVAVHFSSRISIRMETAKGPRSRISPRNEPCSLGALETVVYAAIVALKHMSVSHPQR